MISNPETYGVFKSKLENLPKNVVVVASHTQTDSRKEKVIASVVMFAFIILLNCLLFIEY